MVKTGRKVYLVRRIARVVAYNADHALAQFRNEEGDFNEIEREITYEYEEMKEQDESATEAEDEDEEEDVATVKLELEDEPIF